MMTDRVHLRLALLALAIALMIKFAVHEENQISERVIEASVTYNHTAGSDVVSYDKVETIRVGVKGPSDEIAQLSVLNVQVVIDLPPGYGPVDIALEASNVRFPPLADIEVMSFEPNRFTIQVEKRLTSTVPVIVSLVDEPAAGAQHGEPLVRPAWVEISGPESLVSKISRLPIEVSLTGHARTFEDSVQVVYPDNRIQVQPGRVLVKVPMQEPELSIDLQIESPAQ
jgi:YbbR domain-containing protein